MLSLDDTNSNSRLILGTRSHQRSWASLCYSSIPGVQVCFNVLCPSGNSLYQSGNLGATIKHAPDSDSCGVMFLLDIRDVVFDPSSVLQCIKDPASCSQSKKLQEGITSNIYSVIFSSDTAFTCDSLSTSKTHCDQGSCEGTEVYSVPLKGTSC